MADQTGTLILDGPALSKDAVTVFEQLCARAAAVTREELSALTKLTVVDTDAALAELAFAHLVIPTAPGTFTVPMAR